LSLNICDFSVYTVVEHSNHNPEIEGLNPAIGNERERETDREKEREKVRKRERKVVRKRESKIGREREKE
jgi:hypothetical protein